MFTLRFCLFLIVFGSYSYAQIEPTKALLSNEYIESFDLKGNVKSVEIRETKDGFDSNEKITNITNLHFNKEGYLLKSFETYGDGFKYLDEENVYNNNLLVQKTLYSRKREEVDGKLVFTTELLPYQIKYTYDLEGKLLAKHEKSHRERDFFLTEIYKYSNRLLVEELVLNTHFGRNRMEWESGNYLIKNYYNMDNQLINQKKYDYEAKGYSKRLVDSAEQFEVIIHEEKTLDSTKFKLEKEWINAYNKVNQLISQEIIDYSMPDEPWHTIITYEYFGNKQSKLTSQFKDKFFTIESKDYNILNKTVLSDDYQVINNDTLIIAESVAYKHEASEELKSRLLYSYEYNTDGTYLKFNFDEDKTIVSTSKYNSHGHLIEIRNDTNRLIHKINYKYDTKGNWINKQWVFEPDSTVIELVERKIDYYD